MARQDRALGRHTDEPQLESINLNAGAAVGAGADYEHVITAVPNLAQGAPSGTAGLAALNRMFVRWVQIVAEAAITGVATNNVTYNINQRRNGALLVNTTINNGVAVGPGSQVAVILTSVANIIPGMMLTFAGGTAENAQVQSVNAATNTVIVNLANAHNNATAVTSAPLATITFAAGVNAVAFSPIQLACVPNEILPGDVLTIQRFTNGTGLATPALTVSLEWVNSKFY